MPNCYAVAEYMLICGHASRAASWRKTRPSDGGVVLDGGAGVVQTTERRSDRFEIFSEDRNVRPNVAVNLFHARGATVSPAKCHAPNCPRTYDRQGLRDAAKSAKKRMLICLFPSAIRASHLEAWALGYGLRVPAGLGQPVDEVKCGASPAKRS